MGAQAVASRAPGTRFLDRDGRRLAYDVTGEGDSALVLVHGWTTNRRGWGEQVRHFSLHRMVVTVDLRGHGESDPCDCYEVADYADDLLWTCGQLGLDRPVLVGHSLGGMVVTEAGAAAAEGQLGAIVTLDAPLATTPHFAGAVQAQIDVFGKEGRDEEARALLEAYLQGPYDDRAARALDFDEMLRVPAEVGIASLRSIAGWPDHQALLRVRVPVLAIDAGNGGATDPRAMAAGMPNVFTAQTIGSGHFIQNEVPDQVNAMIDRFLAVIVDPAR